MHIYVALAIKSYLQRNQLHFLLHASFSDLHFNCRMAHMPLEALVCPATERFYGGEGASFLIW